MTTLAFGGIMTQSSIQSPVTIQELLVSILAQTDALAKLLIEKGLITRDEFMQKIVQRAGPSHTLDLKSPFHPARAEITTSAMHKQAPVKAAIMSFWASHSSPCVPR